MLKGARAVIPAAGRSSRFAGGHKLLHELAGVPVICHVLALYRGLGIEPVVVVPAQDNALSSLLKSLGVHHVSNPDPAGDMLSSVRLGLGVLPEDTGPVFVHPADIPAVLPRTILLLCRAIAKGERAVVSACEGRTGHPLALEGRLARSLAQASGTGGLRGVLHEQEIEPGHVDVADSGTVLDVDTVEDACRVERLLRSRLDEARCVVHLVRHAHIDTDGRFVGAGEVMLSGEGREQAARLGRALAAVPYDSAWSSPLSRAVDTALAVLGERGPEVLIAPELREIHLGVWQGMEREQVRLRFARQYAERGAAMGSYRIEGGESFENVRERAMRFLAGLEQGPGGRVLAMAHAGLNRALLCSLLDIDLGEVLSLPQDHCAVNVLALHEHGWEPLVLNSSLPGGLFL